MVYLGRSQELTYVEIRACEQRTPYRDGLLGHADSMRVFE